MSAHAETVHDHGHHGPPPANQSSRLDPTTLGMFLFIASEAMNRNIPRVAESSRELWFAAGGPWCAWTSTGSA